MVCYTSPLFQIQNAHGESEITAMVIDLPTKMLSGSSDGTIKIWDINTTACHRVLQAGMNGPVDILQVGREWLQSSEILNPAFCHFMPFSKTNLF